MKPKVVALIGHVGNSVLVRGGLEVHLNSMAAGLSEMGYQVVTRLDQTRNSVDVAIFFGAFYGTGDAFQAMGGIPRIVVPTLLHSENSLKAWRLAVDPLRSHIPSSLLSHRRRMIRDSHMVLPSSIHEAKECRSWGAFKIRVVPVPIDSAGIRGRLNQYETMDGFWKDRIEKLQSHDGPLIISVGRLEKRKNHLSVVKACEEVDAKLVVIGRRSPTERDFVEVLRNFSDRLHDVWEDAPDSAVAAALNHANVHVLASNHETAGLVSLEAAVLGARPVAIQQATAYEYLTPFGELARSSAVGDISVAINLAISRGRITNDEERFLQKFDLAEVSKSFAQAIEEVSEVR